MVTVGTSGPWAHTRYTVVVESRLRVCVLLQACRSQSRRPPDPGSQSQTCPPRAQTATLQDRPTPCDLSSWLCFFSLPLLAPDPPAFDLPKHRLSLFPTHSPFPFQPGRLTFRFLSITLHYFTLNWSASLLQDASRRNNTTGPLRHCSTPESVRGFKLSVCLYLPCRLPFTRTHLAINSDDLDATVHYSHRTASASLSRPGTDDLATACRRSPALCAHQEATPPPR